MKARRPFFGAGAREMPRNPPKAILSTTAGIGTRGVSGAGGEGSIGMAQTPGLRDRYQRGTEGDAGAGRRKGWSCWSCLDNPPYISDEVPTYR